MSEPVFKMHVLLDRAFAKSTAKQQGEGSMPAPTGQLLLAADQPQNGPTLELLPGLLSHYPLKLFDILLGEKLRAYFDFYCADLKHPMSTCFDRGQLEVRERELIAFASEPVASWNLVQLRVAKMFIDHAPERGRAVSLDVIGAFNRAPQQFYAAMLSRAPGAHLQ